ncbi:hypothetical protein IFR05_006298 [Cadophora sp. M221]|nr:hypothetical protein IFR05_006298 [Cadophora sp. M221]
MDFSRDREEATESMDVVTTDRDTIGNVIVMAIERLSITAVKPQPQIKLQQWLLRLPSEILSNILSLACTHDKPIKPYQWLPGSTKFTHDTIYTSSTYGIYRHPARVKGRLDPALAAVDLAQTCRAIGNIVVGDCLMYKHNEFEFHNTITMLTYLVALTPERRNAITSIRVLYDFACEPAPAFVILSTCKKLRHLELDITVMSRFFRPGVSSFDQAPGYAELVSLRGVTVKLVYSEEGIHWNFIHDVLLNVRHTVPPLEPFHPQDVEDLRHEVRLLNESINEITNVAHPQTPIYTVDELQAAADRAAMPARPFGTPHGHPSTLDTPAQQDVDMIDFSSGSESSEPDFEIPTEAREWYSADYDPIDWN